MSDNSFDAFARSAAAAIDRRKSLRTLGGAALVAALANPLAVESAKDNKAKKAKKKAKKKCRRQVGQCQGGVEDLCQLFFP